MSALTYYRADRRIAKGKISGRGLYDDGGRARPKHCKTEVAFAGSPGGALYGALQNMAHDAIAGQGWPTPFFGDDLAVDQFIVYETDVEPDYHPCSSSMDDALGVETDFCYVDEVRYCNKAVPVRPYCIGTITEHDIAIASSVLYKQHPYLYFDFDDLEERMMDGDVDAMNEYDSEWEKIVAGDEETIAKRMLDSPLEKDFDTPGEGLDSGIVRALMKSLEAKCRVVRR